MAHHVYQTEAFVLRGANIRESNRFVDVFSRELGLVKAIATSARKERSKMRYGLQDYTHLDISLVRGREVWRITGAKERSNVYYRLRAEPHKLLLFKKVNSLLKRLLHGEEKNEQLFDTFLSFIDYLEENDVKKEDLLNIECLAVLRILFHLGYVANREILFETNDYEGGLLTVVSKSQKKIVDEINDALKESQL